MRALVRRSITSWPRTYAFARASSSALMGASRIRASSRSRPSSAAVALSGAVPINATTKAGPVREGGTEVADEDLSLLGRTRDDPTLPGRRRDRVRGRRARGEARHAAEEPLGRLDDTLVIDLAADGQHHAVGLIDRAVVREQIVPRQPLDAFPRAKVTAPVRVGPVELA